MDAPACVALMSAARGQTDDTAMLGYPGIRAANFAKIAAEG